MRSQYDVICMYLLGSVMLPTVGPLSDQYVFVIVKFLCVKFSIFS